MPLSDEHARLLLKNLVDRGATETQPRITPLEIEAIGVLLGLDASRYFARDKVFPNAGDNEPNEAPQHAIQVDLKLDGFDESPAPNLLMCIDFGTSFSKAFAVHDKISGLELIDLPMGQGDSGKERFFAAADILIDKGSIFFGLDASSRIGSNNMDRIIQSPKQLFTMSEDATTLRYETLNIKQDPQQIFSVRDVIVLYLSYLNFLSESELAKSASTLNVSRRFTHPAWKSDFRDANKREMSRMMAEAIVLSRNLSDLLVKGLPTEMAASALRQARSLEDDQLPLQLVAGSVREATAAGAGALLATDVGKRQGYLIVDVGAGTTDIAGFVAVHRNDTGEVKIIEIEEAAIAIRWAGNLLDQYLSNYIIGKSGFSLGSAEAQALENKLRKERRNIKEQLFTENFVMIDLSNDTDYVEVELDDFLATEEVKRFTAKLHATVAQSIDAMGMFANKLMLVATGGGASLPMVEGLASVPLETEQHGAVKLTLKAVMSEALVDEYPELEEVYPQLAVAIGGALPELPEERSINAAPGDDRGPLVFAPNYR